MIIDRGIVRVGMEIEIAQFSNSVTFTDVAEELIQAGYMMGERDDWLETHTYGCTCTRMGCRQVRSGDVVIPPLVSLTYDASLPSEGAEFVTSTILLAESGLAPLREIWDITTRNAVWNNTATNRRGNAASPSIHLHVSAQAPDVEAKSFSMPGASVDMQDTVHLLSLFAPEFLALASMAAETRGLHFRQPLRVPVDNRHHGFINAKNVSFGEQVYLEWRMWEAAYQDWDYVEAVTYLSAVITRALLSRDTFKNMMAMGYAYPYEEKEMLMAVQKDSLDDALAQVSLARLRLLRDVCLGEIDDDPHGADILANLFMKAEEVYDR